MAKLIIDGITENQAKVFAEWYEGQGEQDADFWFEINGNGEPAPLTDVRREGGYLEKTLDGDFVMHCRMTE